MSKRETIMAALFAALEGVASDGGGSVPNIDRNGAVPLDDDERPAIRMWDGDEVSTNRDERPAVRRSNVSVTAQPAIAVYVEGTGAAAGTAANALMARVQKAIWTNAALATAIGTDATITQESLVQDLTPATKTQAALVLTISIPYQFNPASP